MMLCSMGTGTLVARRGRAVFIAEQSRRADTPVHFAFVPSVGRRCYRRCHVGESYDQRAVGRPIWAHVRDRRRRHNLRHRRHRRRHLLPLGGSTYLNDVLKSADGGADRTRRLLHEGVPRARWVLEGHCRGTLVVPLGVVEAHSFKYLAVLPVPQGHETGTRRDTQRYSGYSVVLRGLRRLKGTLG
jgi:hypothetical protein